jgi:hypothetical protein
MKFVNKVFKREPERNIFFKNQIYDRIICVFDLDFISKRINIKILIIQER